MASEAVRDILIKANAAADRVGVWVASEDMHPTTNIAGRKWMTDDGRTGIGGHSMPRWPYSGLRWWFEKQRAE